jgi:hypothetical protein
MMARRKVSGNTRRVGSVIRPILAGLIVAQFLAFIQVYLANDALYRAMIAVGEAGYFTVPNRITMPTLNLFGTAFWGGLFFTLSVGLGVTLCTMGAFWVWEQLFHRNRFVGLVLLLPLVLCILSVNAAGFNLLDSLYFLLIPMTVILVMQRTIQPLSKGLIWTRIGVTTVPLVLLALLLQTSFDSRSFIAIRDNLLLSNPIGVRLNDFYYNYTLYPAEAFKTLDQKLIKIYQFENDVDGPVRDRLTELMLTYDYLPVSLAGGPDLDLGVSGKEVILKKEGRVVLQAGMQDFIKQPQTLLKEFSLRTDQHLFFRQFAFLSIVMSLLLFPFLLVYGPVRLLIRGLFGGRMPAPAASIAAAVLAVALLGFGLYDFNMSGDYDSAQIRENLEQAGWQQRVALLKHIAAQGGEVGTLSVYKEMLTSPNTAERYWLARALGKSRRPETYDDLLSLLNDPQHNVVCMAFYGLGHRGEERAIQKIITRIQSSDHWYEQWYGYRALKSLGWRQEGIQ